MKHFIVIMIVMLFSASITFAETEFKVTADDTEANDYFGNAVSVSGDYAVVGAYDEDPGGLVNAGSAYIYHRIGETWTQQAKLVADDAETGDKFGNAVSISGDYAIVGAVSEDPGDVDRAGSAYIFHRSGDTWTQQAHISADDKEVGDGFGKSVSISGDYAIVGAENEAPGDVFEAGSAYIFHRSGENWTQQAHISANDKAERDYFGNSISVSGDYAIVGAYGEDPGDLLSAGSAYIFHRSGDAWTQQAHISADDAAGSDFFGRSISISGDYAIVGAYLEDPGGLNAAGSAYIFHRSGETWTQQAHISADDKAASDLFGVSASISGDYAIAGAYIDDNSLGSAYVFKRDGEAWNQVRKLTASDRNTQADDADRFGFSVSIEGNYVLAGAYWDDDKVADAGSAYFYNLNYDYTIPQQTYVMMGIPTTVSNGNPATLFQDDFGGGNPGETWRCSRWSVANQEYARYGEDGSGDPADFVPGNGYWMITDVDNSVLNIPDNLDDGHVAQDARYVHDLESVTDGNRGINQIANPFHYPYDWRNTSFYNSTTTETKSIADAATGGWVNGYAYTYDYVNSQYVAVNWTGASDYTINTWQGFWCEVLITDGMQARFQPNGYAGGLSPEEPDNPGHRDDDADGWALYLQVSTEDGQYRDEYNIIGIHPNAEDGYDVRDAFEFTPVSDTFVQLYFPYEGDEVQATRFTYDYRSNDFDQDKVWDFVIHTTNLHGEELVLTWPNIDEIDWHYFPTLHDEDGNLLADLWEEGEYRFDADSERHFSVRVHHAPESVTDNKVLTSTDFGIVSAHPNPFNCQVRINYNLLTKDNVTLNIVDLNGRLIKQLAQNDLTTGQHQTVWNAQGQPSGIYFARMDNGTSISYIKLMLLK